MFGGLVFIESGSKVCFGDWIGGMGALGDGSIDFCSLVICSYFRNYRRRFEQVCG